MIRRQHSRHNKEREASITPSADSRDILDLMDRDILVCIQKNPGLSMMAVYRCYVDQLKENKQDEELLELQVRYRINTLEKAGYIRTERVIKGRAERQCYIAESKVL